MINADTILEFDKIKEAAAEHANTAQGKASVLELKPVLSELELRKCLRDTTQARELLDTEGTPPIPMMERMEEYVDKAVRGELLLPEQFEQLGMFLAAVERLSAYLKRGTSRQIGIAFYGENLNTLESLREELEQSIRNGRVDDYASGLLKDIRRELTADEEKMKSKAEAILRSQKSAMAEDFLVTRNGRICLPVKKDCRSRVPGAVVDRSSSGATVFIEPDAILRLREEYELLKVREENEEQRILYCLSERVVENEAVLRSDIETVVKLDFIFAKGKYSAELSAVEPKINTNRNLRLKEARHPLLNAKDCVPLNFELCAPKHGMIITGPNTGGKTVSIKTVGLFCLMACSGLHLPCAEADICMNNAVYCDIGDGQNITDNLSTFSAHIRNVVEILQKVSPESLVILDELGSGTDPAEGMGIAVAILDELRCSGCLFLVTTHYPEVKLYAAEHEEILNARMAFDRENLRPLYRLEIGAAGESCALYIAKRLGMPDRMLLAAAKAAYGGGGIPEAEQENAYKADDIQKERQKCCEKDRSALNCRVKELAEELGLQEEDESGKKAKAYTRIEKTGYAPGSLLQKKEYSRGDSVIVYPEHLIGIVVVPEDDHGMLQIQIKKKKRMINRKRVKLKVKATELYPEDYDFSIIFDTVENRKARHEMDRKYTDKTVIVKEDRGL